MAHSADHTPAHQGDDEAPHRAGAFDIRVFIASLLGIYGLVLLVVGLLGPSESQLAKADGLNINLWAGLGMVAVSAAFLLWAKLRPVVVPAHVDDADDDAERRPPAAH